MLQRQLRSECVAKATLLKPYPQYGNITQTFSDVGEYNNQSLQIRVQRPFSSGFTFMASYAYVRADSLVFYDEQDQYDMLLTSATDANPRHRVVSTGSWLLPVGRDRAFGANWNKAVDMLIGGWQLAGTYTYRGGSLLQFASMVAPGDVKTLGGTGAGNLWFDTTGFGRLPAFTRRSNPLYYDNLRGPTFHNVDAVLSKKFRFHERFVPEFRLEAYNALNKLNWANPNVSITSSDFGRTNAPVAGNLGRQLRYALRFEF